MFDGVSRALLLVAPDLRGHLESDLRGYPYPQSSGGMILVEGQIRRSGFPLSKTDARMMAPSCSSLVSAACTWFN